MIPYNTVLKQRCWKKRKQRKEISFLIKSRQTFELFVAKYPRSMSHSKILYLPSHLQSQRVKENCMSQKPSIILEIFPWSYQTPKSLKYIQISLSFTMGIKHSDPSLKTYEPNFLCFSFLCLKLSVYKKQKKLY